VRIAPFAALRQSLRRRALRWALRRQGHDALPLTLRPRRIYILPTRAGCVFGALIAVSFLAGLNYGNGVAMLLTFWLAGFAGVAMLRTHRCLSGTTVTDACATPNFAGSSVTLCLTMTTVAAAADIRLSADSSAAAEDAGSQDGQVQLRLQLPAPRRGRWVAPPLHVETRAPFGLFRTWTWMQLDLQTLVYPRPAGARPVPEAPGQSPGRALQAAGLDELATLRPFREGDSPRQVAWKAYARGAPLLVREYRGNAQAVREFDFEQLQGLDTEWRLSQLCRWIIDAAARGETYALRLPGSVAARGNDERHRARCLRQLALYGDPAGSAA
jgi:uncharacterized protein (DUF58 family)